MLRPDGSPAPGSPFNPTGSIWGAWTVSINGNDHVWVSNFASGGGDHRTVRRADRDLPGRDEDEKLTSTPLS